MELIEFYKSQITEVLDDITDEKTIFIIYEFIMESINEEGQILDS